MTFDEVWNTAPIGAAVTVSNGRPSPAGGLGAPRYNQWRSHNFSGELLEKIDGAPRVLRISDAGNPKTVAYDVCEDVPHTFELAS